MVVSSVLHGFDDRKRALLDIADQLRSISESLSTDKAGERVEHAIRSLEGERFDLAVFGRFKSGKSTFINAILGEDLLPSGILPLTSIVTRVICSKERAVTVSYQDGRRERIELTELPRYITERGNPENRLKVKEVEVSIESDRLKDGVSIVDTPGTGSTLLHNTLVTNEYLEHADAGIFIFSAESPISEQEMDFLRQIKRSVEKLLIVLNKIDRLAESEWQEVLTFSKSAIQKALGHEGIDVHPLSSKQGMEGKLRDDPWLLQASRFNDFEEVLEMTLMQEKGARVLGNARRRLVNAALDMRMAVSLELEAIKRPLGELEEHLRRLKDIDRVSLQRMKGAAYLIDGLKGEMVEAINDDLSRFLEENRPRIVRQIRPVLARIDRSLGRDEYIMAASEAMRAEIVTALEPFLAEEQEKVRQGFDIMAKRFQDEANSIISSARETISESVALNSPCGMDRLSLDPKIGFVHQTSPVISYDLLFVGEIQSTMPGPLLRRIVERRASKMIPEELEKNAGMFRYDLITRLSKSSAELRSEYQTNLRSVIETTENALLMGLEDKRKTAEDSERRSRSLIDAQNSLERISSELDNTDFALLKNV